MKNLFLATAVAVLACTGCTTGDEGAIPIPPQENPVNFSTEIAAVTRTAPNEKANFANGDKFSVTATQALGAAAATSWMDNLVLTKSAEGTWSAGDSYFFMKGYKYSFAAYSPTETVLTMTDPGAVPYTVVETLADQKDLLYAVASKDFTTEAVTATVAFTFNHALTQVRFSAKTAKDYSAFYTVTMKNIALKGVNSQGTLNFSDGSWTLASPAAPLDYSVDYDKVLSSAEAEMTTAGNDVLMLIPQDPAGAEKLVVTFDVAAVSGKGDPTLAGAGKTLKLDIPSKAWTSGYAYTYQITLNLDGTFGWTASDIADPTISPWKDGDKIPVNN